MEFEELLVDFVRFTAFAPASGSIFKAKLVCEETDWHRDSFVVSQDNTVLNRFHGDVSEKKNLTGPEIEEGWTDFELKFGDVYQLVDGRGQSWIAEEISPKCKVGKVEISEGQFARECSEGTLKWEVKSGKCAFVPISSSKSGYTLNLTLMSRYSFSPIFHLGGTKVGLGVRNGKMVVADDDNAPLQPSTQRVRLHFKLQGNISCKV